VIRLSARLADAEKVTVTLKREEAEKTAQIAQMANAHEAEMKAIEEQLQATKRQLDVALTKSGTKHDDGLAEPGTTGAKKPSKMCAIQ
jgi:DNA-binding protein H-NS